MIHLGCQQGVETWVKDSNLVTGGNFVTKALTL